MPRLAFFVLTTASLAVFLTAACVGDEADTTPRPPGDDGGGLDGGGTESSAPDDGGAGDAGDSSAPICDASPCVVQLAAGGSHTCARIADGTVRCWGLNAFGECGGGTVSPPPDGGTDQIVTPSTYAKPNVVNGITTAMVVGAGGSYRASGVSCVGTSDQKMSCWGIDKSYQLGRGDPEHVGDITPAPARPQPAPVVDITNLRDVSVGVRHVCAVFKAGAAACWGGDLAGALGIAPAGKIYGIPQVLAVSSKFDRVVSRGQHNLALAEDKKVWSWGDNADGQHGVTATPGTPAVPEVVAALSGTYSDIAAGRFHGCALDVTGKVWCWGKGSDGQLGRGAAALVASDPVPAVVTFAAGTIVKQISGDEQHMVAMTDDGTVYEWGTTVIGIPPDTRSATVDAPVKVALPKAATQVVAGYEHACALLDGGAVYCWGNNRAGELGRGTKEDGVFMDPAPVVF